MNRKQLVAAAPRARTGLAKTKTAPPPLAHRADGVLVDAGTTFVSAPLVVDRAQWLLDESPRQGLAAIGLYALLVSGWSAWRTGGRVSATVREISSATGSGPKAVRRSLRLLARAGLLTATADDEVRLESRYLPRSHGWRMEKDARALGLVHREVWTIRQRLARRDDVSQYHLLRDLGAHVLDLLSHKASVPVFASFDRRTAHRRARRLRRAELRVLALVRRVARQAVDSATEVAGGAPPGGWPKWREGLGLRPHAPPPAP